MEASSAVPSPCEAAGPAIFAYDGSPLAGYAIEQAGIQLAPGREALIVCVWQPADVGFMPIEGRHLHAAAANEVEEAAKETAAHGAEIATAAGFKASPVTVEAAPTWKGLVQVADEHKCGLIVIGSHQRSGLLGHLAGSVAAATVSHFESSVLVIHQPHQH
ncbi:MAG TPA: universal stress protein [Solirubrobacterales bacterium]|jgi:nucleotide-binding universal stress UspA family protein|nr:universal stress protein [Solirubrobacterales bacterium]